MDYHPNTFKSQDCPSLDTSKANITLPSSISIKKAREFASNHPDFQIKEKTFICGGSARPSRPHRSELVGSDPKGERSESLLYLNSNISPETPTENLDKKNLDALSSLLSPYSKRVAFTLQENVKTLTNIAPSVGHIGFLTLTFPDNVKCPKEASKRFDSFNKHYLSTSPLFSHWVSVRERQARGAWHYHILVILTHDIQKGFDWKQYDKALDLRDSSATYRSPKNQLFRKEMSLATKTASPDLKKYWRELRLACSKYRFGRSEMLPIKTNIEAMTKYVGKYISKELAGRDKRDKGVRLISYSKGWLKNSSKFQWNSEGSWQWRRKLSLFARLHGCPDLYALKKEFGPRWAYLWLDEIVKIDDYISSKGLDPEKFKTEDIPDEFLVKMQSIRNVREAKKPKKCPLCGIKSRWQWQGDDLYCSTCASLIF